MQYKARYFAASLWRAQDIKESERRMLGARPHAETGSRWGDGTFGCRVIADATRSRARLNMIMKKNASKQQEQLVRRRPLCLERRARRASRSTGKPAESAPQEVKFLSSMRFCLATSVDVTLVH